MNPKINELLTLSSRLPTGLNDPKAIEKYQKESLEFAEAWATYLQSQSPLDLAEAMLEAADKAYYAVKAWHNNLISSFELDYKLTETAYLAQTSIETVLDIALAKYALRARPGNPKDKVAERQAALSVLSF